MEDKIKIKGAREHNLKDIDLVLPRDKFIVITGVSGSGKSTLAFDTLYAEGQRRYVESLSAYARQFLGLMDKPDVDSIEGLSPAISIEQKTTSKNPRSTVGTVTEVYDYLRLLFARVGTPYCPNHDEKIAKQSPQKIAKRVKKDINGKGIILAPIIKKKKGNHKHILGDLNEEGYTRARVNGEIVRTDEEISLERYKKHNIEAVIDRVNVNDKSRLIEAIENAVQKSDGLVIAMDEKEKDHLYSSKLSCPKCGIVFEELEPRMFSFNSPFGACDECKGLGIKMDFDPDLIIPDKEKSIADGAIAMYGNIVDGWRKKHVAAVGKHFGFDIVTPIKKLTEKQYNALMHGTDEEIEFKISMKGGKKTFRKVEKWEGLLPQAERLYHNTKSDYRKKKLENFMRVSDCPGCNGKRLKDKILSVKAGGKSIIDITDMSI